MLKIIGLNTGFSIFSRSNSSAVMTFNDGTTTYFVPKWLSKDSVHFLKLDQIM